MITVQIPPPVRYPILHDLIFPDKTIGQSVSLVFWQAFLLLAEGIGGETRVEIIQAPHFALLVTRVLVVTRSVASLISLSARSLITRLTSSALLPAL